MGEGEVVRNRRRVKICPPLLGVADAQTCARRACAPCDTEAGYKDGVEDASRPSVPP